MNGLFFLKIDVAFETFNCFGVCNRLGEPSSDSERVGAGLCGAVKVLSFKSLGVN